MLYDVRYWRTKTEESDNEISFFGTFIETITRIYVQLTRSMETKVVSDTDYNDISELGTTRDRAIRLFTFLRSISELRTTAIRSLNQYEQVIWLNAVPRTHSCYCAAWDPNITANTDVWVEIAKPRLLPPPEPSEDLLPWVRPHSIGDSSVEYPELADSMLVEEPGGPDKHGNPTIITVTHRLEDHPEVSTAWDNYVQDSWWPWAERDRELRLVQNVYNDLFAVYQKQQRLGEAYEVVIGMAQFEGAWN